MEQLKESKDKSLSVDKLSDDKSPLDAVNAGVTPLMQQYLQLKSRYKDEVLFFRLGDFYEMFFDDAVRAAKILQLTLTKRQTTPMCGVPHHAASGYIAKLLKNGFSVAMAEQLEDPKKTKGMVKRDVVRVITPGTIIEDELLPSRANNFLVAIAAKELDDGVSTWGLAAADVSTGQQWAGGIKADYKWSALKSQLAALAPAEILLVGETSRALADVLPSKSVVRFEPVPQEGKSLSDQALKSISIYLKRDRADAKNCLLDAQPLPTEDAGVMFLDETAVRHLELVTSADPAGNGPTLIDQLDRAITPMGSRLLRWWLLHPSTKIETIQERHTQVEDLLVDGNVRFQLRALLEQMSDLERIAVRTKAGTVSPRDLSALRESLDALPQLRGSLVELAQETKSTFAKVFEALNPPTELQNILQQQLIDAPPSKLNLGGVIRDGHHAELDELRGLRRNGKQWIAEMEAQEREKTGITTLKVGYNDVFGYYLEVSKSHLAKAPADWIRKQTLANAERYITPALKEQEEKLLHAEEKILALETQLFAELVHEIGAFVPSINRISEAVAHLDAIASLADVAAEQGFVRPRLDESASLVIKGGRHPVIEKQIGRHRFIANDVRLDDARRVAVITGPNMAGKSTYLRQTALIVIMAQMGSFVPAESAEIGIVDRIFTRIGASDRLAQGQSTFMVEMQEVATLLHSATPRSLLVLDEVGRGTSTYDGVSIAWAVIDHLSARAQGDTPLRHPRKSQSGISLPIHEQVGRPPTENFGGDEYKRSLATGPRTLFATHYFELTQLADTVPGVFNAHATAKEWPDANGRKHVVFLYQILPGPADKSYGIHVAEMAGLPEECVKRAREILKQLESGTHNASKVEAAPAKTQLDLFGEHPVVSELKDLSVENMTPLQALNKLAELKKKAAE